MKNIMTSNVEVVVRNLQMNLQVMMMLPCVNGATEKKNEYEFKIDNDFSIDENLQAFVEQIEEEENETE